MTTDQFGGSEQRDDTAPDGPSVDAAPGRDGEHIDGRLLRSLRTRDRVIDAFLALIEDGDHSPTAQRVAARANVSLRTVFHQFEDLDTLHRLAGERLRERIAAVTDPIDLDLPLTERLAAFSRRRANILTVLHPLASAARLREPDSEALRENRDALVTLARTHLETVFASELGELPPTARGHLVGGLMLVSSWSAWWQLREESGLDAEEAEAVMHCTLAALLVGRNACVHGSDNSGQSECASG